MMDQQEKELRQKLAETKEEAKKRILSAKERCEAAETKVQQLQSLQSADSASQAQLIQALREEGEKLAHKQSTMEQAVRAAKTESRNYKEQLETEEEAKNSGLEKIAKLESELKSTKELLSAARKGESQASKLEQDLMAVRSDAEMKASTILSLQQQVKELVAESKDMQELLERARKEAQKEVQLETKTLRREHNDVISDLETKLRTTEREAGVREDALRHEVSELRKRWEDAVRRADGKCETRHSFCFGYIVCLSLLFCRLVAACQPFRWMSNPALLPCYASWRVWIAKIVSGLPTGQSWKIDEDQSSKRMSFRMKR
jgi:chemotaxis protein histidine kinase CheA